MWYLYTMEIYPATKNKILSFVGKCMELEKIILSEVKSDSEGQKAHVLPHMWLIDLKQIQQYYRTWVTLRRGCIWEG
jgi:hypothetical protein